MAKRPAKRSFDRSGYAVTPSCRVKLVVGFSRQDEACKTKVKGKYALSRLVARARRIVARSFPNGHTMVQARGGWRCKPGVHVREPSLVAEIAAVPYPPSDDASATCSKVFETATKVASTMAREFEQQAVMATYVGSGGSTCTAFVPKNGIAEYKGRCAALVRDGVGGLSGLGRRKSRRRKK